MTDIALYSEHANPTWLRQTPGRDGRWGAVQVHLNARAIGADWLVVYDDMRTVLRTDVPAGRRILVVSEPPGVKTYLPGYTAQFGTLLSPMPVDGYAGRFVRGQTGLPWWLGLAFEPGRTAPRVRLDFAALRDLPVGEKRPGLSAVVSTKDFTDKHRRRVEFVVALQRRLGDRFVLFGRGFAEIGDKADAILPYSHHLVIENNDEDGFFTEKLADSLLGWSVPLFSGCRDIGRYVDPGAIEPIDIDAPGTMNRIEAILREPVGPTRLESLAAARNRILHEHNLFALLARVTAEAPQPPAGPRGTAILKPNAWWAGPSRRWRVVRRSLAAAWKDRSGHRRPGDVADDDPRATRSGGPEAGP
ncbi:hypothetical protein [Aquibium microcysteis]|uniref:hypothetical protein n=1 Tax=Aquibium microcysteis TaxID=675281 RepID=UPI00165CEF2C|nr:hypothetical protein [Aquibium microcysteis]